MDSQINSSNSFVKEKHTASTTSLKVFSIYSFVVYICAFFSGRAVILESLAPFGAAFFIAALSVFNRRISLIAGLFVIAGYFSSVTFYAASSHTLTILLIYLASNSIRIKKGKKNYRLLALTVIVNLITSMFFNIRFIMGTFRPEDFVISLAESLIIIASSYIFTYGIPVYMQLKNRTMLSKEEIICIGFTAAIVVAGIWDIRYMGFSLRNMLVLFMIIASGYIEGPATGAACGVILGFVYEISDASMPIYIGVFAFTGLMSGIFKEVGKYITALAFICSGALLSLYISKMFEVESIFRDTIIPAIVFMSIPNKCYIKFGEFFNSGTRNAKMQKHYIQKTSRVMDTRLEEVSATIQGLSDILNDNMQSEAYCKNEMEELVENTAQRVCGNCDERELCWEKQFYRTYDALKQLIQLGGRKEKLVLNDMPEELERKCVKANEMIRQVNWSIIEFKLNARWRKRILNSRKIVAQQLTSIYGVVKDMVEEASTSFEFKNDIEEEIAVALDKEELDFDDIIAVKDKTGRYEVSIYKRPCNGQQLCSRKYLSIVSNTLGVNMVREDMDCRLNSDSSICQFSFVQQENFAVSSSVASRSKQNVSGDSYYFGTVNRGRYLIALSDGMGSGKKAQSESNATVNLLEKFISAGYEKNIAVKALNSVLILRSCDESYATVDAAVIDLYNGYGEFVKVASAPTYIKSGDEVRMLSSSSLPVGIIDDVDTESEYVELKNGDMIIMLTDGIIDSAGENGDKYFKQVIAQFASGNPREVADHILKCALNNSPDGPGDDMTVVVSKIWKNM